MLPAGAFWRAVFQERKLSLAGNKGGTAVEKLPETPFCAPYHDDFTRSTQRSGQSGKAKKFWVSNRKNRKMGPANCRVLRKYRPRAAMDVRCASLFLEGVGESAACRDIRRSGQQADCRAGWNPVCVIKRCLGMRCQRKLLFIPAVKGGLHVHRRFTAACHDWQPSPFGRRGTLVLF